MKSHVAYAINYLTLFLKEQLKGPWTEVKHVFRYLQVTRNLGTEYNADEKKPLRATLVQIGR